MRQIHAIRKAHVKCEKCGQKVYSHFGKKQKCRDCRIEEKYEHQNIKRRKRREQEQIQ